MQGSASNASASTRPVRVLLVDDDEDYARYLRRLLGASPGVQLDVVHDLESGRRALERGRYGVVISDYDLKTGTGVQLLTHARTRQRDGLRILMSGNTSQIPPTDGDDVHYVWDKSWEGAAIVHYAKAMMRTIAQKQGREQKPEAP